MQIKVIFLLFLIFGQKTPTNTIPTPRQLRLHGQIFNIKFCAFTNITYQNSQKSNSNTFYKIVHNNYFSKEKISI